MRRKQGGQAVHSVIRKAGKQIRTGRLPASYTVEAALVVPFILGIVFAFLFLLLYEHDKVILRSNIKEAVLAVAEDSEKVPSENVWREKLQKNLWMGKVTDGKVSAGAWKISGSGTVQMQVSIPVMEYFLASRQTISGSYETERWQPEQFVRQKGEKQETKGQ